MNVQNINPGAGGRPGLNNLSESTRSLPQAENSEINVLGSIIQEGKLIEKANLHPSDFYATKHQEIFRGMKEMEKRGIPLDISTLFEEMREAGKEDITGGFGYLSYLVETTHTTANIDYHTKKVKEASQKRKLWEASQRLSQAIEKGADDEKIAKLQNEIKDFKTFSCFELEAFSLHAEDLEDKEQQDLIPGFLPQGALMLLAGKYGAGKSVISLAAAKKVGDMGEPVIYVDADMPLQVVNERLVKSGLKTKLGHDFSYLHRSKCNMKIGDKAWSQFLVFMKGKNHHVIILDNLKDLIPGKTNINLDSDVVPVMDEIKTLRDYGHTVLLLHHWGREGSTDNPFKNSLSIGDAVDIGYGVQKDEDGTKFLLRCF